VRGSIGYVASAGLSLGASLIVNERSTDGEHDVGVPEPVVAAGPLEDITAEPCAEKTADLVREHHDAEKRRDVAHAVELADEADGWRHGGEVREAKHDREHHERCARLRREHECEYGERPRRVEQREHALHAPAPDRPAGGETAGDIEKADERQRPGSDRGRQPAKRDNARQVRRDERDVKAANEEARSQEQEARIARRVLHRMLYRLLAEGALSARMLAAQHPRERHDREREKAECRQRADPPDHASEERSERCYEELTERAAGIHHAARKATLLGWYRARHCRHQYAETRHATSARRHDADQEHQHPGARRMRREHGTQHHEHGADSDDARCPVLVGHRAGDRLRDAPH
jgi:hypothetical protein